MTKMIAIPFQELKAVEARHRRRVLLQQTPCISEQERAGRVKELQDEIVAATTRFATQFDDLKSMGESDEVKEQLEIVARRQANVIGELEVRLAAAKSLKTFGERENEIAALDALDADVHSKYGVKELDDVELAQRLDDEKSHDEYVKKLKYKDDRAAEYPAIGEQLDAIWKALDGNMDGAASVLQAVKNVKAKYPKPELL